jgi:type VI secretion system secreted protein Hcp
MLCTLFVAAHVQAEQIFVRVEGTKQGKFKGEIPNYPDKFEGVKFSYEVISPRDAATGQAIGRRQHKPIHITKQWGAASPQLFSALVTNEMLKEVVIDFVGSGPGGQAQLLHSMKLTNAFITEIKQFTETAQAQQRAYEEVAFTFQKIEISDLIGKTSAMDDWSAMP